MRYGEYFSARWRKFIAEMRHLPATLRMVRIAAPRWALAWIGLLVVQGLLPVPVAYLSRSLVNSIVANVRDPASSFAPTLMLAALMAALFLASEAIQAAITWVKLCQSERLWDHVVTTIQQKSTSLQMACYDSPAFYDRIHRVREEGPGRALDLIESMGSILQNSLTLAAMFAIILPYGLWPALWLIVGTLPAVYLAATQTMAQYELRLRHTEDTRRAWYYDGVLTARETAAEVRTFGLGPYLRSRYADLSARMRRDRERLALRQAYGEGAAGMAGLAATGVVLMAFLGRARTGAATLGDLAFFYQAFQNGLRMMRALLAQAAKVYSSSLFLGDYFEFLDLPAETAAAGPCPINVKGEIEFRSVTFTYPGAAVPAVHDLDLTIPASQKVAIVGMNGAGKTTLIRLLCRFYEPDAGAITLDGTPINGMPIDQLRRQVSALFQEPVRYAATARENIWFGDVAASPDDPRLQVAAKRAAADVVIEKLPASYDTPLGRSFPGGVELSHGEWQRLALARAYLRDSPVIVLDEPTSAMDPWAEFDWLQRFRYAAAKKTVVIITHRFSTAMQADVIHLMKDGRIHESGSHQQLVALNGEYARAWHQASSTGALI